jgi:hypothetical protein
MCRRMAPRKTGSIRLQPRTAAGYRRICLASTPVTNNPSTTQDWRGLKAVDTSVRPHLHVDACFLVIFIVVNNPSTIQDWYSLQAHRTLVVDVLLTDGEKSANAILVQPVDGCRRIVSAKKL